MVDPNEDKKLDSCIKILACFSSSEESRGFNELVEISELARQTVYDRLQDLIKEGYVKTTEIGKREKYLITPIGAEKYKHLSELRKAKTYLGDLKHNSLNAVPTIQLPVVPSTQQNLSYVGNFLVSNVTLTDEQKEKATQIIQRYGTPMLSELQKMTSSLSGALSLNYRPEETSDLTQNIISTKKPSWLASSESDQESQDR